jgi:hypothetical protein
MLVHNRRRWLTSNSTDAGADVRQLKLTTTSEGKVQTIISLFLGFDRMVDAILIKTSLYHGETGHILYANLPGFGKSPC